MVAAPQQSENPLLTAARAYAARGWHVFPLHGRGRVTFCDCGDEACASPAKHPWTRNGVKDATTSEKQIHTWWQRWPRANIGVACGPSGLVVLDVDRRHNGEVALAELARRYADEHGQRATPLMEQLVATLTAATGGGGWHYVYQAPAQGRAQIRNKQHLDGLDGLDVRGVGGYIVAPPSRHASDAPYLWQAGGDTAKRVDGELGYVPAAPAPLPAWLLQILTRANTQPPTTMPVRMLPDADMRPGDGKFWLDRALAMAREGDRNATGFWLACQLRDDGVSRAEAEGYLLAYAVNVPQGSMPYLESEALRSLAQAYSRPARERARSQSSQTSQSNSPSMASPGVSGVSQAAKSSAEDAPADEAPAPAQRRYQFMSDEQVEQMPPPEWLIGGYLVADTLAVLYGEFGSYKSFLALDWAMSVAAGVDWCGQPVKQGRVVYVAGEGIGGLGKRLTAWKLAHDWPGGSAPIHLLGEAPQFLRAADVTELQAAISELPEPPALIVIDTLARSLVGGDENSAQDMGLAVAAAEQLRAATSATVLLIHHKPKGASGPRGSSALPGAVYTSVEILRDEQDRQAIFVHCEKQKDAAPFDDRRLRFEVRVLDEAATETSGVLVAEEALISQRPVRLPPAAQRVLGILQASSGLSWGALKQRFIEQYGMSVTTLNKSLDLLEGARLVENVSGFWRAIEQ